VNDWHGGVYLARSRVNQTTIRPAPLRTLDEQSVDQNSILRALFDLLSVQFVQDCKRELKCVDRFGTLAGICLKRSGHKAVWKEETREPEASGMAPVRPLLHEVNSVTEVSYPRGQRLQRRIGHFSPNCWNLVICN